VPEAVQEEEEEGEEDKITGEAVRVEGAAVAEEVDEGLVAADRDEIYQHLYKIYFSQNLEPARDRFLY
jgi:hypothetical protein